MIVSDTSPIISLMKADSLWVLEKIFSEIIIPREVYRELITDTRFADEIEVIKNSTFIRIKDAANHKLVNEINKTLDKGESEAIALAKELNMGLLIDEASGRKVAKEYNLEIIGTIGVLGVAYKNNWMSEPQIKECQRKLTEAKRRIPDKLFETIFKIKDIPL